MKKKTNLFLLSYELIWNWFDYLWFIASCSNQMLFTWTLWLETKTSNLRISNEYITCRFILESGTFLPVCLAPCFNCSLSLTRLRKSERHFECLTKKRKFEI